MGKILINMVISLLIFTIGCGDDQLLKSRRNRNPGAPSVSDPLPPPRDIKELEKEIEARVSKPIGGVTFIKRLPKETLAAMDNNVEEQTTEWGCGKVSSHLTVAAAQWVALKKVSRQTLWKCSVPGAYKLTVDAKLSKIKAQYPNVATMLETKFNAPEVAEDGEQHVRVGALPDGIEEYVNKLLQGTGKKAILVKEDVFTLDDLKKKILDGVAKGMPTIFLHRARKEADSLMLHYAVAVGLSDLGDYILYMDTHPQGAQRLKSMPSAQLWGRMDMKKVKEKLETMMAGTLMDLGVPAADVPDDFKGKTVSKVMDLLKGTLGKGARIPDDKHIKAMKNFNLVTF